jgi:hypothetical protein
MHAYPASRRMPAAGNECWLSKAAVAIIPCADQSEARGYWKQHSVSSAPVCTFAQPDRKRAAIAASSSGFSSLVAVFVGRGAVGSSPWRLTPL